MVRFGQNSLNWLRKRHSDVVKMLKIRNFILKKGDFILILGKKENLKSLKRNFLSEKGNIILKLSLL